MAVTREPSFVISRSQRCCWNWTTRQTPVTLQTPSLLASTVGCVSFLIHSWEDRQIYWEQNPEYTCYSSSHFLAYPGNNKIFVAVNLLHGKDIHTTAFTHSKITSNFRSLFFSIIMLFALIFSTY